MVPSSSRSRRYGLPSGKTARATRAVSSGTGGTRRSGSDTERPQEERWRYSVNYYIICPCPLEVNSPAVSFMLQDSVVRRECLDKELIRMIHELGEDHR